MAKRRTKREKINPHHRFTISWSPEAKNGAAGSNVKRQITRGFEAKSAPARIAKSAETLAKQDDSSVAKRAIFRSLLVVSFILSLELVIYLAWH